MMLAALAPLLAGCDESSSAVSAAQPSEPDVSIVVVKPQPRAVVRELPGRISPTRVAEVRPRVSGIIVERLFRQGSDVKAGDPLYRIDPRPFEVEVMANEAALAKAEAALQQAVQQARRISTLFKERAAPEAENEKAIAAERQAQAEVEGRKAELARAKLNLDYATVRAPIDGVVGAALVSEGALVVQNETNLATVQQLDPIYADFTQSVAELNKLRGEFDSGALEKDTSAKVRLILDDGQLYPHEGKLLFSDSTVDPGTGQVTLRGEFPNPNLTLLPGMYVRVQIVQGIDPDALAVPQQAVRRNDAGGSELFVVRDDNRAALVPVHIGHAIDDRWLILDGVKPGDRIIVEGFQKFIAGDVVRPKLWRATEQPDQPTQSADAAPTHPD